MEVPGRGSKAVEERDGARRPLQPGPERIYMDYQASTPLDPRVVAAMTPYFFEHPGNPHASEHVYGWEANAAVETASSRIAAAIGADPDEIVFTSGATESNNLALLGAVGRRPLARRHRGRARSACAAHS